MGLLYRTVRAVWLKQWQLSTKPWPTPIRTTVTPLTHNCLACRPYKHLVSSIHRQVTARRSTATCSYAAQYNFDGQAEQGAAKPYWCLCRAALNNKRAEFDHQIRRFISISLLSTADEKRLYPALWETAKRKTTESSLFSEDSWVQSQTGEHPDSCSFKSMSPRPQRDCLCHRSSCSHLEVLLNHLHLPIPESCWGCVRVLKFNTHPGGI